MWRKALAILVITLAIMGMVGCSSQEEQPTNTPPSAEFTLKELNDVPADPMDYEVTDADLQLPELPTGCEATALATLLRLNGVQVTKLEVADAMPKSDWDFVDCFWGDPYSPHGGMCMSPCSEATANEFLYDTPLIAYRFEGYALEDLPTPCAIWVTINLIEPELRSQQGDYSMYNASHCVVLLKVDGDTSTVIDPLKGKVEYNTDRLAEVYDTLGAQAIYIN